MKLVYTKHLKERLADRKIPLKIVRKVFQTKEAQYYDHLRHRHIYVSKTIYKGKIRKMLVAYDKIGRVVEIVTTHPITDRQINQRLQTRRFTYENKN